MINFFLQVEVLIFNCDLCRNTMVKIEKLIKLLFEITADGHVVNTSLKSLLGLYYVHKLPQLSIPVYVADERKTELLFHVVHL